MDEHYIGRPSNGHGASGKLSPAEHAKAGTDPASGLKSHSLIDEGGVPGYRALDGLNLMFLLRMALRHWRVMLLFGILGVLAGIVYLQVARPIYSAQAELEMNVQRPKMVNTEAVFEDAGSGRDTDTIFNTRFAKFKSSGTDSVRCFFNGRCIIRFPQDHIRSLLVPRLTPPQQFLPNASSPHPPAAACRFSLRR